LPQFTHFFKNAVDPPRDLNSRTLTGLFFTPKVPKHVTMRKMLATSTPTGKLPPVRKGLTTVTKKNRRNMIENTKDTIVATLPILFRTP
jgi:hypothetical protein